MEERILFDGQIKVNTAGQIFRNVRGYWRETSKPNGKNTYLVTRVSINGWCKNFPVHRLVAMAFIPNPENKPFVNHLDGNKQHNGVDNLEWVTQSENVAHAWHTGLNKGQHNRCSLCGKMTTNYRFRGLCTCNECREKYGVKRVYSRQNDHLLRLAKY